MSVLVLVALFMVVLVMVVGGVDGGGVGDGGVVWVLGPCSLLVLMLLVMVLC